MYAARGNSLSSDMRLAVLLICLLGSTSPSPRCPAPPVPQTRDTLDIFLLHPGYRLVLRDSIYLCRTPTQLHSFLKVHARRISGASIRTAPEEPLDSVMPVMQMLDRFRIQTMPPPDDQ